MVPSVKLWPVQEADLDELLRFRWDPTVTGEHQWFGFRMANARALRRRWHEDGLTGDPASFLTVLADDGVVGLVTWRSVNATVNAEIGIALFPEHRRRGIGTAAQRQLVDHLFSTTTAHRLQAGTEVTNIAEQRALERVGFRREGVQRGLTFRDGRWRDAVMYGLLRDDGTWARA
jgi:RimJ/RimL family protein N-acetyltransferase